MSRFPRLILLMVCGAAPLAACGQGGEVALAPTTKPAVLNESIASPAVTSVSRRGESLTLSGSAPARSQVRVAAPGGEPVFAQADSAGLWTLTLPGAAEARLFGVSARVGGRALQAQGYLLITPQGEGVLLRAGAGAERIGLINGYRIAAVDFDREGGAVVSGSAPAGAAVSVRLDGVQVSTGRADAQGRVSIALPQPVGAGGHRLELVGETFRARAELKLTPGSRGEGPYRATQTPDGLRIDWLTPGQGLQSTVIFN